MQSPDKTVDNRPEHLATNATMEEMLVQARMIDMLTDTDERESRTQALNLIGQYAIGDLISLDTSSIFLSYPNTLLFRQDTHDIRGRFQGFRIIDSTVAADMPDDYSAGVELIRESPLTMCVNLGTSVFGNGFTTGTFELNAYVPVGEIENPTSISQLQRIFSAQEEVDDEKVHLKLLKMMDLVRNKIGNRPIYEDYRKLSLIEPWDFRGSVLSIDRIRRHKVDVTTQRASVFFTDEQESIPISIDCTDLSFSGYFWATAALSGYDRTRKPSFVFELYETENDDINALTTADPTNQQPLVYIPISDKVRLDVTPSV